MKVKIKDICNAISPGISARTPIMSFPFIGLYRTSSNTVVARVFNEDSQIRLFQCLFPREDVDIYYLCAVLDTLNLSRYLKNTALPRLVFRHYCDEEIELPSLGEQKRFSTIFKQIQRAIEIRNAQMETCYSLQKSLYIHEFGDTMPNDRDSNWIKLKDIAKEIISRSVTKKNSDFTQDWAFIYLMTNESIQIGKVVPSETPVPRYDYLIQADTNIIEPDFLIKTMEMPYFRFMITRNIRGTSPINISLNLDELYVYCPPITAQQRFLAKIQKFDRLIEKLRKNAAQWELTYKSCVQKYLI